MGEQSNIGDRNAGYSPGQEQVWGFSMATGIEAGMYFAPGAKRFYVDPNNTLATDAGNLGENPTVPLATVQAAVTLCRDHMGDTIFVAGNDDWQHAPGERATPVQESVVIPYTKGGIRIVGTCNNPLGVTWSPAATGEAALTVHAIDVLVEGFCFQPVATVANGIGILIEWDGATDYGDNCTVRRCHFSFDLDYGIQLDFSYYSQIYNCYFDGAAVADIHNLSVEGDPDYLVVRNNTFIDSIIAMDLGTTDYMVIENNIILNGTAGLVMTGGSDNAVQHNKFTVSGNAISAAGGGANIIHANEINAAAGGTNNMINLTGGTGNLVSDNWLSCSVVQYDTTCSDATSGAWVNNHCTTGDTVLPPT